jgi:hypothetical protein
MTQPQRPSLPDRLGAAAISLKMISAKQRRVAPWVTTIASRFDVDERDLRRALRSRATQETYDRILSNDRPEIEL